MISRCCWPTMSATTPYIMPAASIHGALYSVTLYQGWPWMTPCIMCTHHTTWTSEYQDFFAKSVAVIHVVVHCTVCVNTSSLSVSSFRQFKQSPAIRLHELTCALRSFCDFVPAQQQISTHQGRAWIVVTEWLCTFSTAGQYSSKLWSFHDSVPTTHSSYSVISNYLHSQHSTIELHHQP